MGGKEVCRLGSRLPWEADRTELDAVDEDEYSDELRWL